MLAAHIFDRLPKPLEEKYDRKDSLARPHLCGNTQSYRNCKRFLHSKGRYCRRIPKQGDNYCRSHAIDEERQKEFAFNRMPAYAHRLKGNLAAFVKAQIAQAPTEQVSLLEELALCKHSAGEVVTMYQAAVDAVENGTGKPETIALAGECLRDVVKQIADLSKSAVAIEQAREDNVSIHTLTFVLNQVVALLYEILDEPTARLVDKAIEAKVILPNVESQGTTSTPDQIVAEMDNTIPTLRIANANGS